MEKGVIELSDRKLKRLENKKRKLRAFLDLVESNEKDKQEKLSILPTMDSESDSDGGKMKEKALQPARKKPRKDTVFKNSDISSANLIDASSEEKTSKKKLSQKEFFQLKQQMRERQKKQAQWPRILINNCGESASLRLDKEERQPIFMSDVQSLIVYSLIGVKATRKPRFCDVLRWQKISHVVIAVVDGLTLDDILSLSVESNGEGAIMNGSTEEATDKPVTNLSNDDAISTNANGISDDMRIRNVFPKASTFLEWNLEVISPANHSLTVAQELVNLPLTTSLYIQASLCPEMYGSSLKLVELRGQFPINTEAKDEEHTENDNKDNQGEKKKKSKTSDSQIKVITADSVKSSTSPNLLENDKFDRTKLLLTPTEMIQFGYPMPNHYPSYKMSKPSYDSVTPKSPMYCIDCEMCRTAFMKNELTSISVVDEQLNVVYNTLVKPETKITDYLTPYSGITAKMLEGVTTTLEDVQRDLTKLLPKDAILVGHTLNSDLNALQMMHPYILDVSLVYNLTGYRKRRSKLRHLTAIFLGKTIQDNIEGHDPTEDAVATMQLAQLKLKHDLVFGDVISGGFVPAPAVDESTKEPEMQMHTEQNADSGADQVMCTNLFQIIRLKNGCESCLLSTPRGIQDYLDSVEELKEEVEIQETLEGNKQVSRRCSQTAMAHHFTLAHMKYGDKWAECNTEDERQHLIRKLDVRLHRIADSTAQKSLLVVLFSQSASKDLKEDLNRSNGFVMWGVKGQTWHRR